MTVNTASENVCILSWIVKDVVMNHAVMTKAIGRITDASIVKDAGTAEESILRNDFILLPFIWGQIIISRHMYPVSMNGINGILFLPLYLRVIIRIMDA